MSKIRSLLDRLVLPALGLGLATCTLVPYLIGIGTPGFGVLKTALLVISLGLLFVNFIFPIRPLTALETLIVNSKVGWQEILLLGFSVVLTGLMADTLLRFILPPTYGQTKYGWTVPANKFKLKTIEDTTGQFREITVRYFQNGFKRWGNPNTDKRKLFVIGDSFTEMPYVSNGEEWYSYFENQVSNIELFVFGGGGYGSLQEYMVFDDYIDSIKPDVMLWQFCGNDYSNNFYDWDLSGYPFNNHMVRPYLEEDRIVYRLPLPYAKFREYSFIADRLLKEYDGLMWRRTTQDLSAYLRSTTELHAASEKLFKEKAYHVTLKIMKKVKERAKEIPIYLLNTCNNPSEHEYKICSETGITCFPGLAKYMDEKRDGREIRVPNDGHWNKLGNQLAGERLIRIFRDLDIVKE